MVITVISVIGLKPEFVDISSFIIRCFNFKAIKGNVMPWFPFFRVSPIGTNSNEIQPMTIVRV